MTQYPEIHEFDGAEFIRCSDFDRVTTERDAALGRVTELESSFDELAASVGFSEARLDQTGDSPIDCANQLQQRLTAADERDDRRKELLRNLDEAWNSHDGRELFGKLMLKVEAALKPAEEKLNQCDGCQAGIPVVNGAHRMGKPGGYPDTMSCTAKLYKP